MNTLDLSSLRATLEKHGQSHLLAHWDSLTLEKQTKLHAELTALDLEEVCGYFARIAESMSKTGEKLDDKMQPLTESQYGAVVNTSDRELDSYANLSYEEISKLGKIAWYIMTSASTVEPTVQFFSQHNYFGLDESNVFIFQQGTLPCFTLDGKIILGEKWALSRAPDGNGGLYRALRNEGVLADMKLKGIKYIQLYCVDNVLVKVGDPVFMGYCLSKGAECANKVVRKGFPTEAVGITCKVAGHYQVVEYSEITQKSAERRNKDGSLTYSAANICIHLFTFDFLERVVLFNENSLH